MASETLESHLEGHDVVKVCLPMASETLETRLQGHDIVWESMPSHGYTTLGGNLTLRAMIL